MSVCEYVRDKYVYGFFGVCFCGSLRLCVFVGVYVTSMYTFFLVCAFAALCGSVCL